HVYFVSFSLLPPPTPQSPLFPYTTLFRSIIPNIPGRVKIPPPACQLTLSLGGPSFNQFNGFADPLTLNFGILIFGSFQLKLKNPDRKSTRLNSSHVSISYAVFCLKKKI